MVGGSWSRTVRSSRRQPLDDRRGRAHGSYRTRTSRPRGRPLLAGHRRPEPRRAAIGQPRPRLSRRAGLPPRRAGNHRPGPFLAPTPFAAPAGHPDAATPPPSAPSDSAAPTTTAPGARSPIGWTASRAAAPLAAVKQRIRGDRPRPPASRLRRRRARPHRCPHGQRDRTRARCHVPRPECAGRRPPSRRAHPAAGCRTMPHGATR